MNRKSVHFGFVFITGLFLLMVFSSQSAAQESGVLPPLKIVHLGDSYSAGNGARSASGDQNYYSVSGCYRSPTNWGSQFADSIKDTFTVTYINRACSGGVVRDITESREMDDLLPILKNLDGSCPSEDYPDEEHIYEKDALQCSRFIDPQIEAIDNSVDLVLLTIGGNDLNFDQIVKQCFVVGMRHPTGCKEVITQAERDLPGLQDDLIETFEEIRKNLRPDARVVYVSYPHLLPDVEYKLVEFFAEPYDVSAALRSLAVKGDNAQRAAVEAANNAAGEEYIIFYDGTKALFEGHEPDPSVLNRNPDRWINEFEGLTVSEWYHPNPLGHENWGRALSPFETFGAASSSFGKDADVDVVFVVDTTGSMSEEIAQVRADLSTLVDKLASTTNSYRVAVVSYRDFPERTGDSDDYPFRVDQTFTNELSLIQAAIDSLTAYGGEDTPETVFSGIQAAIELPWRPGVTKTMIVIGDAPALSPEPISGLTASQVVANSIAVDPVQVIGVDISGLNDNGALGIIADGTGGSVVSSTTELTDTILEILDLTAKQPFAWVGQAYSGKIGEPIRFDASGSYDPSGFPLSRYEWDFDGDGIFDLETIDAEATHTYGVAFDGFVVLRVTSPGGTALASARTVVNEEGFVSQGDEVSCELDENGYSIIVDEEGIFIPCTADSLPESDMEGISEIVAGTVITPEPQPVTATALAPARRDHDSGVSAAIPFMILVVLGGALFVYYAKTQRSSTGAYLQMAARKIPLQHEFAIGRGPTCNLRLEDAAVSRRHAIIRYAQGDWFIQDQGSQLGTFVNGQQVQALRLNNGDQIRIGSQILIFRKG